MKKKQNFYQLFFILLLCATTFYIAKDIHPKQFEHYLDIIQPSYLILSFGLAIVYLLCESVGFHFIFKTIKQPVSLKKLARYSFVGFYFSAITPSSTGGQPMQMYAMKQDDIPYRHSSIAMMLSLLAYQCALLFLVAISLIFSPIMTELSSFTQWILLYSGIANILLISSFLLLILSKQTFLFLLNKLLFALHQLHLIKSFEEKKEKAMNWIDDFAKGMEFIKANPFLWIKLLFIYLVQFFLRFSILYLLLIGIGVSSVSLMEVIAFQSFILLSTTALPLPGGVGISESLYATFLTKFLWVEDTLPVTLLLRFVSFYSLVFLSAFIIVISSLIHKEKSTQ